MNKPPEFIYRNINKQAIAIPICTPIARIILKNDIPDLMKYIIYHNTNRTSFDGLHEYQLGEYYE
jgi:hypothetical protein